MVGFGVVVQHDIHVALEESPFLIRIIGTVGPRVVENFRSACASANAVQCACNDLYLPWRELQVLNLGKYSWMLVTGVMYFSKFGPVNRSLCIRSLLVKLHIGGADVDYGFPKIKGTMLVIIDASAAVDAARAVKELNEFLLRRFLEIDHLDANVVDIVADVIAQNHRSTSDLRRCEWREWVFERHVACVEDEWRRSQ